MSNAPAATEATLEVVSPDNTRNHVRVTESPFYIGRGEAGNHIPMHDRRISRRCAAIVLEGSNHYLEDRGHHLGIFVNGKKVSKKSLEDGDVVSFGLDDSYKIVYRFHQPDASSIQNLLTRMASVAETAGCFRRPRQAESFAGSNAPSAFSTCRSMPFLRR